MQQKIEQNQETGRLSPFEMDDKIINIYSDLEKAWTVCSEINEGYFGYSKDYYEEHPGVLLEFYDKTRIFVEIVAEKIYSAKMELSKLKESVDKAQEGDNSNEN